MNRFPRLHGLYAITDPGLVSGADLPTLVEAALAGGARIIQYRDKGRDPARRLAEIVSLRRLTERYHALLIVNDDVELAYRSGADGVHLGKRDATLAQARQRLGSQAIIGISCYNRLELARQAAQAGADYVAFGRFFPSQTKPEAVQAELKLLQMARQQLNLPLVAIGGITPENGARLIAAGADMLAVIHGVFAQPDIQQACVRFQTIFQPEEN
jgi:thiamine-phosphate pyrophosphorylase